MQWYKLIGNVLAAYKADAPYAHLQRPDLIEDVNVPVQKFYKDARLLPETPRKGVVYVKPSTAHLASHFREQIEQIWEVRDKNCDVVLTDLFLLSNRVTCITDKII